MTNSSTPIDRRRVALISVITAVLVIPLTVLGVSVFAEASSSSAALDSSVVATVVFPASAGIPGTGPPAGHGANSIEVSSWSWGASNSSSGSTGGVAGKVKPKPLTIVKTVDSASPLFFSAVATGHHYSTVILYLDESPSSSGTSGAAPSYSTYMTITLTNVVISADAISGGGSSGFPGASGLGAEAPKETLTLNFSKILMTYSPPGSAQTSFSGAGSINR